MPTPPACRRLFASALMAAAMMLLGACTSKVEPATATSNATAGVQSKQSVRADAKSPTRATEANTDVVNAQPCSIVEPQGSAGCQRLLIRGGCGVDIFDTSSLDVIPREPITGGAWKRPLDVRNEFPVPKKEGSVNSCWLEQYEIYYRALTAGTYVFEVSAGATDSMPRLGRRLIVDGQTVFTFSGRGTRRVSIELPKGYRQIQVQFVESADERGVIPDRCVSIAVPGTQNPTVIMPEDMLYLTGVACGFPTTKYAEVDPIEWPRKN